MPLDPVKPKVEELAKAAQVAPRLIKDAAAAKKAGLLDEVKDGTISAKAAADMARGKVPAKSKRTLQQAEAAPRQSVRTATWLATPSTTAWD